MVNTNMEYWKKALQYQSAPFKKWFKEEKRFLRKIIKKDSKILDLGCGEGRSINDILDITQNITGIDHDKKAVDNAKKNFNKYPSIKILLADADNLLFNNNTFDFVMSTATLSNFGNKKQKILSEMKRVLKDDGTILLSMYSEDAFEERIMLYKKLNIPIKKIIRTKIIFDYRLGDNISEQYSKDELIKIFNDAKLKIITIKKAGIAYLCELKKSK